MLGLNTAKDFFGQELKVGDKVASLIKDYRGLTKAEVIKITPQNIRVTYKTHNNYVREYLCPSDWVVKEPDNVNI